MNHEKPKLRSSTLFYVLIFIVSLGVGGLLMYFTHQGLVPGGYLLLGGLLLACIVVHLFMHRGHGRNRD